MYKRNRYYDPKTGQFTQEDPIGLAGGLNLYGYAGGDPVNYSDPFGLNPCLIPPVAAVCGEAILAGVTATLMMMSKVSPNLASSISGAADAIRDKVDDFKFVTYTRTNAATGEVYSGRTSGFGDPETLVNARAADHPGRLSGFGSPVVDRVARGNAQGRAAIRGREQQLIDAHGGARSEGGTSANLIRGVSRRNPLAGYFQGQANNPANWIR